MRLVSIEMLKPDMTLAFPVFCRDVLILPSGRDNIARYIPNLTNMGIRFVYVEDKESEGIIIPDAISSKTRKSCKETLRATLQEYADGATLRLGNLTDTVEQVIRDILKNKDILVSLNDIGTVDEYTYQHSVNVTVYSLLIGRALHYNRKQMEQLAMGMMLHDIGKTLVDPEIQFKAGVLTEKEFYCMKKHAEIGYEVLGTSSILPEVSRKLALIHHERLDGLGYPQGLKGEEVPQFGRIAAIADVYDALISDRCYKVKWPMHRAVDLLIENSGTQFEPELVQLFIQQIAVYPNGSMVALSNGCTAIVKEQNKNVPLRPIVRVIINNSGKHIPHYEIDLMQNLAVTITESELEINGKSF